MGLPVVHTVLPRSVTDHPIDVEVARKLDIESASILISQYGNPKDTDDPLE